MLIGQRAFSLILILTLLLAASTGPVRASEVADAEPVLAETTLPENLEGTPGATTDWWSAVQEDIRQSEYHITWQEHADLDVAGVYQAPNRAHNLRTTFTPQSIRVVPRAFEGETPPWEWGLALTGYGRGGDVRSVADATLYADANRISYERDALTEWYVNDERGLEQGFTLTSPPSLRGQGWSEGDLILELLLNGDLTPNLTDDGSAIEFTTTAGVRVLRYSDLHAYDATGRDLPAQMRLVTKHVSHHAIHIVVDDAGARYPLTVDPLLDIPNWIVEYDGTLLGYSVGTAGDVNGDGYSDVIVGAPDYSNGGRAYVYHGSATGLSTTADWFAEGNQAIAEFGFSVGTAGDVDGDGYADIIVGARYYDNGQTDEGRAYVYHGSASGLSATPAWTAESNQAGAEFGFSVGTAGDVNGDGYSDVIVGARRYDNGQTDEGRAYVYHGSASGLSATPAWTAESDQDNAEFGFSVGTAGDVDGDGYSDVIVGARYYDNGQTDEGRAYVYHGSVSGLSTTPAWTVESDQDLAALGTSVGTAGDVNGDGYSDVIVGAPYINDGLFKGRAYVYHGSAAGLSATPAWTDGGIWSFAEFGHSVGTAGDVNGDGYADVIIGTGYHHGVGSLSDPGVFVYHGSATGFSTIWEEDDYLMGCYNYSVGTAGDVNGDGYSDIIVGKSYDGDHPPDETGEALVYLGSAGGPSSAKWTTESDQANAGFGRSVGTAGDVNGDGYADVVVGASDYDNGPDGEGCAWVYHGSPAGPSTTADWSAEGDQLNANFGYSVGTAGDVNGDGYDDVIVGAYRYDNDQINEGQALVYYGSATGLSTTPAWTAEGDQLNAYFGGAVGTAGDVNGDGYSDVIVGAYMYDGGVTDEGRATVYHGSATGLAATPAWTAESDQLNAHFGTSVGTAGDVNGDGYSDVIVGAPDYNNGQTDEGRAYVYHGSAGGLLSAPTWTAESDQGNAELGTSVGTAGDVNGDGYADVVIGAPYYYNGQTDEGRATVYYGGALGLGTAPVWEAESNHDDAQLGYSVGTAGDVNGDGYADVIIGAPRYENGQTAEGQACVYLGSSTGLSTTADRTTESDQDDAQLGYSVGTAGDVNGDGYADVIVGAWLYNGGQTSEGRVFLYYGNGGDGLHMLPRQWRSYGTTPIAHLGMPDSDTTFQISLIGRSPAGREDVRLQYQVAPLGTPFDATGVISGTSGWTDVLTTGVEITQTVNGLTPGTAYNWRVRLLYRPGNALGLPAGRWIHIPWNGWNEADLRTGPNQPPVADAGSDQSVDTLALITLDGSASSDPDGHLPLTYYWTQTGGPSVSFSPALSITTFTAPDPTVLTFTLVVTDSLGLPDPTPDEVVITVSSDEVLLPVNSLNDPGDGPCDASECTLREAVAVAESGDTITFDPSLAGSTIVLGCDITLDKNLTIDGSGLTPHVQISGGGSVRVFGIPEGLTIAIYHLDILDGNAPSGGGIDILASTLTVSNTTFSGNSADDGGAIDVNGGTLFVTDCSFVGNSAAVYGGAIDNNMGTTIIVGSTFSGNSSNQYGGGVFNDHGDVTVTNSTFSGNSATLEGGGLLNYEGTMEVRNCTLSGNSAPSGGGILNSTNGTLHLWNTIVANSPSGGDCVNDGTIATNVNNLIEDGTCSPAVTGDPLLGPLADNGGPTQTMALGDGSPAIDAGDDATCEAVDQRGVSRPQGVHCDIGAYETELHTVYIPLVVK
jgi:hypothetical protein